VSVLSLWVNEGNAMGLCDARLDDSMRSAARILVWRAREGKRDAKSGMNMADGGMRMDQMQGELSDGESEDDKKQTVVEDERKSRKGHGVDKDNDSAIQVKKYVE